MNLKHHQLKNKKNEKIKIEQTLQELQDILKCNVRMTAIEEKECREVRHTAANFAKLMTYQIID